MWMYILLVILICCLGVQGTDFFDCGRPGQDCANGKCTNGVCVCDSDHEGYNCKLEKRKTGRPPCTYVSDSCGSNGGVCYKNGGEKACFCPADLYGDHCAKRRYDVKCMAKSMKITVFPAGEFNGKIHLKGHNGCDFTYVSGKSGPMELEVDDAKCGGVTTDHHTGVKSRIVLIQYNSKFISNLDTKLTVTCRREPPLLVLIKRSLARTQMGNSDSKLFRGSVCYGC